MCDDHQDHLDKPFDRTCAKCQFERFSLAKELIHVFDGDAERTRPEAVRAEILERIVVNDFSGSAMNAEFFAELGALELLMPYYIRKAMKDSFFITKARVDDDFSRVASQFCIPLVYASLAFGDKYWHYIQEFRKLNGYYF